MYPLSPPPVEFSFVMVWIVDMRACDAISVIAKVKQHSLEALDPTKTGYTCDHYFDTYDEVVTLARPPIGKAGITEILVTPYLHLLF